MLALLVLLPIAAAIAAFAISSNRWRPYVVPVAATLHLALTIWILRHADRVDFEGWLGLDPLSRLFIGYISLLFFLCSLYAPGYLAVRQERSNRVLCACLLLGQAMMSLVILSHHLGLMWVAMEATTLISAPAIYFNHNPRSLEATWKYLLIGSVGIAVALLGSFFLAYSMLAVDADSTLFFDELIQHSHKLSLPWLHTAFVLLIVGYGTKMGLSPMHTWKPDAYGEAPGMIGALLAGGVTSCAFLAILRFFHIAHVAHDDAYSHEILRGMGLLSMATAAVFMARQRDIKRLLAYSSVEHMGMLVFGMGIGGMAAEGSLLHVVHNGICKAGLFMAAGNIHRVYGSKTTDKVQGVLRRLPFSGALLVLGFFAITGSPLFGPFISEYQILCGTFAAGHTIAGYFFLSMLVIVFMGMGYTLIGCALGPAPSTLATSQFRDNLPMIFPIFICMALTFMLGVYTPPFLSHAVQEAVTFLGNDL